MIIRTEPTNENVRLECYITRCEKATQISRELQLKKLSIVSQFNAKIKIQRAIHSGRVSDATREELINRPLSTKALDRPGQRRGNL